MSKVTDEKSSSVGVVGADHDHRVRQHKTITVPAPDTTPPLVLWSTPQPSDGAVAAATQITAIFSEDMDTTTLNATTFTLADATGVVAGTVTPAGDARSATFAPSALASATSYTATLSTGAQDVAGNGLAAAVSWSFTTVDTSGLTIAAVSPATGSSNNKASTTTVSVTFSKPIDCARVTDNSLRVFEDIVNPVAGYVTCDQATLAFQPFFSLPTETGLEAVVEPTVTDLIGNALGTGMSWEFAMGPWTIQLGTARDDEAYAVATDLSGDIYVAGYTNAALDGYTNVGGYDVAVVKYDARGAILWARQLGTPADEGAYGTATDMSGSVYVVGGTGGGLDGNTSLGGRDAFVIKYDPAGAEQWTRQFGTAFGDTSAAVATDALGNVYVAGETEGGLDGNTNAGSTSTYDMFVVKYDANGVKQWTRQLGSPGDEFATGVVIDNVFGNIYVTGWTDGDLDGNVSAGGYDGFIVEYDATGAKQWTKQFGGTYDEVANAAAIDAAGNIYIAGDTDGGFDGNVNPGAASFANDGFLIAYDRAGTKLWTREFGTIADDHANGVATNANGNVYVAGSTSGVLAGTPLGTSNAGGLDLALVVYNSAGFLQWTRQLGTTADDNANAITIDAAGYVHLDGDTGGGLDGNTFAGGTSDIFTVEYELAGQKR